MPSARACFRTALAAFVILVNVAPLCAPVAAQPLVMPRVGWRLVNGKWLRASGACDWSDLFSISVSGDVLAAQVKLSEKAAALLKGGRMVAVEIGPARDLYNVTAGDFRPPRQRQGDSMSLALRELPDAARPEAPERSPLRPVMLLIRQGAFRIVARGQLRGSAVTISFMCGDERAGGAGGGGVAGAGGGGIGGGARLLVSAIGDPQSPLNCSLHADSFAALLAEHPAELRKYLSPLLRRIGAPDPFAPGAADVYAAFAEVDPDPIALRDFAVILPRLSDPDPRRREQAFADLRALGPPGACAAARWPTDELDPQQQQLVRQYLRAQSRRRDVTAAELRREPMFLIDCLEFDDAQVRSLARTDLERILGRTIAVDTAHRDACAAIAGKLRDELEKRG